MKIFACGAIGAAGAKNWEFWPINFYSKTQGQGRNSQLSMGDGWGRQIFYFLLKNLTFQIKKRIMPTVPIGARREIFKFYTLSCIFKVIFRILLRRWRGRSHSPSRQAVYTVFMKSLIKIGHCIERTVARSLEKLRILAKKLVFVL